MNEWGGEGRGEGSWCQEQTQDTSSLHISYVCMYVCMYPPVVLHATRRKGGGARLAKKATLQYPTLPTTQKNKTNFIFFRLVFFWGGNIYVCSCRWMMGAHSHERRRAMLYLYPTPHTHMCTEIFWPYMRSFHSTYTYPSTLLDSGAGKKVAGHDID